MAARYAALRDRMSRLGIASASNRTKISRESILVCTWTEIFLHYFLKGTGINFVLDVNNP